MRKIAIAAVLGLAGCAAEPRVMSSTIDAVTVRYPSGEQSVADHRAAQECTRYAKRSRLRSVHDDSDGWKMAIYDCIT